MNLTRHKRYGHDRTGDTAELSEETTMEAADLQTPVDDEGEASE